MFEEVLVVDFSVFSTFLVLGIVQGTCWICATQSFSSVVGSNLSLPVRVPTWCSDRATSLCSRFVVIWMGEFEVPVVIDVVVDGVIMDTEVGKFFAS